ncbi:uncharacterized protein [Gossypium hirsutum]|uniref:Uncharacterized protein n=1 Tax=Gossypium hirsutum TaxID=3635 RepID=A0A1U8NWB5_GOSHI|nr:uncharacterized protein LOC107952408 [Gossypium hirsutum]
MNEINKTLLQLLSMLQTAESSMKRVGPKPILMVRKDKNKGKLNARAKPKNNGKVKSSKGNIVFKPKGGITEEGKCFHCGKARYWKRNCPPYLEEVKKAKENRASTVGRGIVVPILKKSTFTSWVLDNSCGYHICASVHGLQRSRNLAKGDEDI